MKNYNKPNACICTYDCLFSEETWGIEPEYMTLTEWWTLIAKMNDEFWSESLEFRKQNSTPPTDAEIVEEQAFADRGMDNCYQEKLYDGRGKP